MIKKIKAFLTAKIFLTRGQIITQGMLYQLEKKNADLRASLRGYKGGDTRHNKKLDAIIREQANEIVLLKSRLESHVDISLNRDPNDNEINSDDVK